MSEERHRAGTSDGRLLTAAEVATRLNLPASWVREQTRAGRMPHLELGRYRRHGWPALVAWLETPRALYESVIDEFWDASAYEAVLERERAEGEELHPLLGRFGGRE